MTFKHDTPDVITGAGAMFVAPPGTPMTFTTYLHTNGTQRFADWSAPWKIVGCTLEGSSIKWSRRKGGKITFRSAEFHALMFSLGIGAALRPATADVVTLGRGKKQKLAIAWESLDNTSRYYVPEAWVYPQIDSSFTKAPHLTGVTIEIRFKKQPQWFFTGSRIANGKHPLGLPAPKGHAVPTFVAEFYDPIKYVWDKFFAGVFK